MTAPKAPSEAPASRPSRRLGLAPWLLLAGTDVVAVSMLARCFSGPGELVIALPACAVAHLLSGGGRRLSKSSEQRIDESRWDWLFSISSLGWLLAILVAFFLPLAAVDGSSFTFGLPLSHTWHLVGGQLSTAWSIFSNKIAPVVEAPGLVLVTGWAAAAVAIAAEVLYADSGLPSILALVPAFDIVVFTGTLGTPTGRAVELTLIAGFALAFLSASQADRQTRQTVVMARTDGGARSASARKRPVLSPWAGRQLALPGVTLIAALAAGVVGPVLPGATSPPLIAWHGVAAGRAGTGGGSSGGGSGLNKISVSNLVQVAEQEVNNSNALLFTVRSATPTREVLLTLNHFDGNRWAQTASVPGPSVSVPALPGSIAAVARRPPPPVRLPDGGQQIEQVIRIAGLGGQWLPTPGTTLGVSGAGVVSELGANGPLVLLQPLSANLSYAVRATLPPVSASILNSALPIGSYLPRVDLGLPQPVPPQLISLAHSIAGGTTSPYLIAERLQDYFLAGHGYSYHLPQVTPTGAIANTSQSYKALEEFLFHVRVGYCQQYATAFAVLARILGLPTRIAIGFLPGKQIGHDTYAVTGLQVHAWPQVDLAQFGWVGFEPTPGAGGSPSTPTTTLPSGPGGSVPPTTSLGGSHFGKPPSSGGPVHLRTRHPHRRSTTGRSNRFASSGLPDIILALLAFALLWAVGV
ncbi:MAG: transglutaminase family protein, partial [Acidimicrobiales bacterium]